MIVQPSRDPQKTMSGPRHRCFSRSCRHCIISGLHDPVRLSRFIPMMRTSFPWNPANFIAMSIEAWSQNYEVALGWQICCVECRRSVRCTNERSKSEIPAKFCGEGRPMMRTIVIILLVLFLLGALPSWPYSAHWGYYPSGGVGLLLIIVIILVLMDII